MDFEVIECPGGEAISRLEQLRRGFQSANKYPFLVGDKKEIERLQETAEFEKREPSEIVAESLELDIAKWFKERRSDDDEYRDYSEMLGEWPDGNVDKGGILAHRNILTGEVKPIVCIGLADIAEPWMLPSVTKYGNWNECPEASVHCALMRRWYQSYGAEIVSMSGDVIECLVKRPPITREDALQLAWEQYWYCMDIVEQGVGNVSNLAATLLNGNYWYFWWD